MPIYLKQATASQEVPLGYFVDSTDGNTAETGLTIANTDIKIWKTGATTLADKNSGGATHIAGGVYYAVLDATDTDTAGPLVIFIHATGALSVRVECVVLVANVYDSLIGGSDALQVHANEITANLITATAIADGAIDAATFAAGAITATVIADGAIDAATFAAGAITATVVADGTIDAATFAAGAITATVIATGAVDADATAADFLAEINAEVVDALNVDTYAEPTGVPGATVSLAEKIGRIYQSLRNKITVTNTKKTFFDDGDAAEWEQDISNDGTTYVQSEANSI